MSTGRRARSSGLRPTLWVLAVIVLIGAVLPVVNALVDTEYETDGTPLAVGPVQITPRDGWGVDPQGDDASGTAAPGTATFRKGATTMEVSAQASTAPMTDLWDAVRIEVGDLPGTDLAGDPNSTTTSGGVSGLRAPLASTRGSGLAAVYSDGETAVQVIAQGNDFRSQHRDVDAMLRSLQFGGGTR